MHKVTSMSPTKAQIRRASVSFTSVLAVVSLSMPVPKANADGHKSEVRGAPHPSVVAQLLSNGENQVDLDGDGMKELVLVARRDDFDAHGYDRVTFVRRDVAVRDQWHIIPFFDAEGRHEDDSVRTSGGADCVLQSLSLIAPRSIGKAMRLLVAQREFGSSYFDRRPVTFTFYELMMNSEGLPGWPRSYWQATQTVRSKEVYCDADDALEKEFGLTPALQ